MFTNYPNTSTNSKERLRHEFRHVISYVKGLCFQHNKSHPRAESQEWKGTSGLESNEKWHLLTSLNLNIHNFFLFLFSLYSMVQRTMFTLQAPVSERNTVNRSMLSLGVCSRSDFPFEFWVSSFQVWSASC